MSTKYLLTHNFSEKSLRFIIAKDGVIMPSLAIINPEKHILSEFGDCVLIASNALLPESMENSFVFTKDAYTIRPKRLNPYIKTDELVDVIFEKNFIDDLKKILSENNQITYPKFLNRPKEDYIEIFEDDITFNADYYQIYEGKYLSNLIPESMCYILSELAICIREINQNKIETSKNFKENKIYNICKNIIDSVEENQKNDLSIENINYNIEEEAVMKINSYLKDFYIYLDADNNNLEIEEVIKQTLTSLEENFDNKLLNSETLKASIESPSIIKLKSTFAKEISSNKDILKYAEKHIETLDNVSQNDNEIIVSIFDRFVKELNNFFNSGLYEIDDIQDIISSLMYYCNDDIYTFIFQLDNNAIINDFNINYISKLIELDVLKLNEYKKEVTFNEIIFKEKLENNFIFKNLYNYISENKENFKNIIQDINTSLKICNESQKLFENSLTTYMEVKITSMVNTNQFDAILIPSTISNKKEFVNFFEKNNLKVYEYDYDIDKNNLEEQQKSKLIEISKINNLDLKSKQKLENTVNNYKKTQSLTI